MAQPQFDVVTGGAGFIGSHVSWALLRRGRRVKILDNFSTGRPANVKDLSEQFEDQIEIIEYDIRRLEGLEALFQGAEIVYHQAAIPSVQRSIDDPLTTNEVNVNGTLNVLEASRRAEVQKVVFASSSSIYGDSETLPKRETMMLQPLSPYAVSKYVDELYARLFSDLYGLPTVGLRYFNVFGPRQDPGSDYAAVIPRFVTRMLEEKPPIIYGDGQQSRDFTFVENVVAANFAAAESEASGISLNIACGERYTLNELVNRLNDILGTGFEPRYEAPRKGDVRHSQAAITLAEERIGYKVEIPFKEGLRQTVEWFQKQRLAQLPEAQVGSGGSTKGYES